MSDSRIFLNFYQVTMSIEGLAPEMKEELQGDFSYFLQDSPLHSCDVVIEVKAHSLAPRVSEHFSFQRKDVRVFGFSSPRTCIYPDGSLLVALDQDSKRKFILYSDFPRTVFEILHTVILSSVGERLDLKKLHRLHALSFTQNQTECELFLMHSGFGKSSLALQMKNDPSLRSILFFSDESPLLSHELQVSAFPLRHSLHPKVAEALGLHSNRVFERRLYEKKLLFSNSVERTSRKSLPLKKLILVKKKQCDPCIRKLSPVLRCFSVFRFVVLAEGNTQMLEYMIRLNFLPSLIQIAFFRLQLFLKLILSNQIEFHELILCDDTQKNYRFLKSDFFEIEKK